MPTGAFNQTFTLLGCHGEIAGRASVPGIRRVLPAEEIPLETKPRQCGNRTSQPDAQRHRRRARHSGTLGQPAPCCEGQRVPQVESVAYTPREAEGTRLEQ